MKLIYPAVFYPFSDGSGGYTVEFPDLPGCVTEGNDLEEAFEMAIDAASGWARLSCTQRHRGYHVAWLHRRGRQERCL